MQIQRLEFADDGRSQWAGMGDYSLVSPDRCHEVIIRYVDEPPHGDSYRQARIDGRAFPGFFWGAYFAFSGNSRFFAGSWMPALYDRMTIVVDVREKRYTVAPENIEPFAFEKILLKGVGRSANAVPFEISDDKRWIPYSTRNQLLRPNARFSHSRRSQCLAYVLEQFLTGPRHASRDVSIGNAI